MQPDGAPASRGQAPRLAVALGAALAAVLLLLLAVLASLSRALIFPASQLPFPEGPRLAGMLPSARLVPVPTADGLALTGAFAPPPADGSPVLLYFHGNAEAAAQNLPLAAALRRAGCGVFLAEYRGYGGQPGSPAEDGLVADGEAALAALGRLGVPPERTVLVGRSLGSGIAVELALRHPVAAVVLVSPYTSIVEMGRLVVGPLASLVVRDRFDNLGKIARVTVPVAVLHGTRDDVVPVEMGRRLAAAGRGVRYAEFADATHNDFPELPERVVRAVGALLGPAGTSPRTP